MRSTVLLFAAIALTVLCWGMYGPVLQWGQLWMSTIPGVPARLRPFVCVGLAYFLIGVIVPSLWLHFQGEKGDWTIRGIVLSFAGGALGALGALGIILAFTFGGRPVYVMPLVFGGAPVINTLFAVKAYGGLGNYAALFLAGLILVVAGAAIGLVMEPRGDAPKASPALAT